jgi:hypothetical protein
LFAVLEADLSPPSKGFEEFMVLLMSFLVSSADLAGSFFSSSGFLPSSFFSSDGLLLSSEPCLPAERSPTEPELLLLFLDSERLLPSFLSSFLGVAFLG